MEAPIHQGEIYGSIDITLNNKPVMSQPLIALSSDEKAGIWTRMTDNIAMTWHGWFN